MLLAPPSSTMILALLTISVLLLSLVDCHSHISSIYINGQYFPGYPADAPSAAPSKSIAWTINVPNNGFTRDYKSPDIICHKNAQPGNSAAKIAAGQSVEFEWATWPAHQGPVLDYMARCPGKCENVDKTRLRWFKIAESGLLSLEGCNEKKTTGCWALDRLRNNGDKWTVTIPEELKAGNYVIRTEVINLDFPGQSQNYPSCANFMTTGGGSWLPEGVPGTSLYTGKEPGLNFNIYHMTKKYYPIPGPPVVYYDGRKARKARSRN